MDGTQTIQELLDRGGIVMIPDGVYEITKPLEIGDFTHVICSPRTVLRLADGADCPIIVNKIAEGKTYTESVTLEGGIWDGNNLGQDRGKYTHPWAKWGQLIVFTGTRDLTLRSLTVKDPESFGIMLTDTESFTVRDIRFDYNKKRYNMDGLHVNGWAKNGYICNLKGSTNDDFVALNSDEGGFYSPDNDIENITIDGIYCDEKGWTGVRLLSRDAHVKHITIRNIYGKIDCNAVSFTHWSWVDNDYGHFDNILIDGIHTSYWKTEGTSHGGLIWFQNGLKDVGNVTVTNVFRSEEADKLNGMYTIDIGARCVIRKLLLSNINQDIPDHKPLIVCGADTTIGTFLVDGAVRTPDDFPKKPKKKD